MQLIRKRMDLVDCVPQRQAAMLRVPPVKRDTHLVRAHAVLVELVLRHYKRYRQYRVACHAGSTGDDGGAGPGGSRQHSSLGPDDTVCVV